MKDFLFVKLQYVLPHHAITALVYWLTRIRWTPWKNLITRLFIRAFNVDMTTAVEPDPSHYEHFNAFFTRALKPEARPLPESDRDIACPVDGAVSEIGRIEHGRVYQAKGHDFSLTTLLGDSEGRAEQFRDGHFATLYLSPRDYHRIHIPVDGVLRETLYVPGRLFSVNGATAKRVPGLFARNERLVAIFDTDFGPMAMVMVGAMNVSSIETVWHGVEIPPGARWQRYKRFKGQSPEYCYARGDEIARFNMGSTVILIFGKDRIDWDPELKATDTVQMGQVIASRQNST